MRRAAVHAKIQGILGTSKHQPHLAALVNRDDPEQIDFMFGTAPLLSYRRDDLPTRNALIGMLCSAGVRLADVARVFGVDPRQARRYADKFETEGLAGLAAAAPGRPSKVTPEVEAFVRAEFRELFTHRRRDFREPLRQRVRREFGVSLGYERLRQITKAVRDELGAAEAQPASSIAAAADRKQGSRPTEDAGEPCGMSEVSAERLRKGFYTRYAGGLLLNVFLHKLLRGTARGVEAKSRRVFAAFSSMVMHMVGFGCVNLERAKTLVQREFGVLVGLDSSPTLKTLRRWLAALAACIDSGQVHVVLAKNYIKHMVEEKCTFYIDGHFGAYTGSAPLLLGYYPQGHCTVPGRTHYMVCDRQGLPVFFELEDESDDLRQAIPRLVRQTKKAAGGKEKLTFVFDRGGYSRHLFASFDEELAAFYIAWEKHDKTDYSVHDIEWHEFQVESQGNHEHKPKLKRLWVGDCPRGVQVGAWGPRSPIRHHRKMLLRSEQTDRDGAVKGHRTAPFLSNDPDSSNETLARKLLDRWHEENEFKALRHGGGLDEITSYLTVAYKDLEEHDPESFARVSQREIDNPRRKKLDAACRKLARRLKTLQDSLTRRVKEGRSSGHRRVREVHKKLERTQAELERSQARRRAEPVRINQLQYLLEEEYERPDFSRKLLVDLLKVCARNAGREAEAAVKKYYLNRRDHVTLVRRMVHAGGWVKLDANGVLRVRLERLNTEAEDEVFEQLLADINACRPRTFGPHSHRLSFQLIGKS